MIFKKLVAGVLAALVVSIAIPSAVNAVNNDTISVYLDAPLVQGSYVSGTTGTTTETFDSYTAGACPSSLTVGTITGTCTVQDPDAFGGATTSGDTQTYGGTGTKYANTGAQTNITIELASPSKYFGFWWSAGSLSNTVKFYSNNSLVLEMTTASIYNLIGAYPSPYPGTQTLTSLGGSLYNKGYYFGNPRAHTSITPTSPSTLAPDEPFAYVHLFAGGNFTFDKVVLSGGGFEFDNMVISTVQQTPRDALVFSQVLYGNHEVQFQPNGGSGSMTDQVASSPTNLTSNSFSRSGYDFVGWNTQADGTGNSYTNQQQYSFDTDLTLHAQWDLINYPISFDTQGGTAEQNSSYTIGSSVTLPSAPSRVGYSFDGWFTASSGGSPLGTSYSPPATGPVTLYAQWTVAPIYSVSFDTQGGSQVSGLNYSPGGSVTLPTAPVRSGFTFLGWFSSPTGGSALGNTYSPSGSGNVTLYAHWAVDNQDLAKTGFQITSQIWSVLLLLLAGLTVIISSAAIRRQS